jgi:7,8-dihydropterin-6-yl-methyl-4-(beta-D-ribofuranosyl)aminobenzene 5'-phosphate synthase
MRPLSCGCLPGSSVFDRGGCSRRGVLRATGVGFVASMVATLVGEARTARAQKLAGPVPEVDRLRVTMLTDNFVWPFFSPQQLDGLKIERTGGLGAERPGVPPRATLTSEWGLSMLAESSIGSQTRTVLVDFGYTPEALLTNMRILGVDPSRIDTMVLSHGHFDHFGGLTGLLVASKGLLKPGLPLFVGGEDCFCTRELMNGVDFGVLDRKAILDAGLTLMFAEGPSIAADHAITTGQIPLVSFEKPLRPTQEKTGLVAGLGCDPAREPAAKNTGTFVPDDFQHEIATSYVVRGQGLVVLTSCSHRGVVNTVRQALAATGVERLHAVIGGFHLTPPLTDAYIRQTVAELKTMRPDFLVTAHCTGDAFYEIARTEMPGQVIHSAVGTRLVFGT